jgi:hydroxyacyl-ACP dehydratase HTD2-like protein with hotdog domain
MTDDRGWKEARRTVEALIGRPAWEPVQAEVAATDILRYQEAVGNTRQVTDDDGTLLAPPLFIPPFAVGGTIGEDGRRRRPGEVVIDHPSIRRRLMAGCDVQFSAPIRAGETIHASSTYESVVEKAGRAGPMLLVTTANEFRNAVGELKRIERWTIIHR